VVGGWLPSRWRWVAVTAAGLAAAAAAAGGVELAAGSEHSPNGSAGPGALWVRHYNGPGNGIDLASSVAVSPDGRTVFVTGRSAGSNGLADYATVAYSAATGARLWLSRYNGPANGYDAATAMAVSPDGRMVFVTGRSVGGPASGVDYATVAYDAATGAQLWVSRYGGRVNWGSAIAVSPDGRTVVVTGSSYLPASGPEYVTVAYNAATGAQLWARRYSGIDRYGSQADAATVSPDSSTVFVTGSSSDGPYRTVYATIAYSARTGVQLWVSRYHGPVLGGGGGGSHIAVSPDGAIVFVTGTVSSDGVTVALSARTGTLLWASGYLYPDDIMQSASSLALSPDGHTVFVTGTSRDLALDTARYPYHTGYATVAYDATTGRQRWAASYGRHGNVSSDDALTVVVSADGRTVFVMGQQHSTTLGFDYATVAYQAATGVRRWVRRYDSGVQAMTNDAGHTGDVAVSPDGHTVCVTGYSAQTVKNPDYLTIAYRS
jgi:PQQ-like domain